MAEWALAMTNLIDDEMEANVAAITIVLRNTSRLSAIHTMAMAIKNIVNDANIETPSTSIRDIQLVIAVVRMLIAQYPELDAKCDAVRDMLYEHLDNATPGVTAAD